MISRITAEDIRATSAIVNQFIFGSLEWQDVAWYKVVNNSWKKYYRITCISYISYTFWQFITEGGESFSFQKSGELIYCQPVISKNDELVAAADKIHIKPAMCETVINR